jgi:putative (di)nucleoside polyphosphate hydrolase
MARSQFFRAGVGICVLDPDGRVLALERHDLPGAWQLPQGGLDVGEEPADAAPRELYEETGLSWDSVRLLGEHPRWLAYELEPGMRLSDTGRGQVQRWFVVRLLDPDAEIDLGRLDARKGRPEFRAYEWIGLDELLDRAAPFRRPVYEELVDYVASLPRD